MRALVRVWRALGWRFAAGAWRSRRPRTPEVDGEFVRTVREHLDPVLLPAGFVFGGANAGVSSGPAFLAVGEPSPPPTWFRETTVLYEAVPAELVARYPALRDHVDADGGCADLWVALDVDRRTVRVELEGRDVRWLLAAVRGDRPAESGPIPADAPAVGGAAATVRQLLDVARDG